MKKAKRHWKGPMGLDASNWRWALTNDGRKASGIFLTKQEALSSNYARECFEIVRVRVTVEIINPKEKR